MPILTILSLAPQVIKAGSDLWHFIQRIRETAKQTGEWGEAEEAAWQAKLDNAGNQPHWAGTLTGE